MRAEEVRERWPDFDTSDVDRWIGVPLGGAAGVLIGCQVDGG